MIVTCDKCKTTLEVQENLVGQSVPCPLCGNAIPVFSSCSSHTRSPACLIWIGVLIGLFLLAAVSLAGLGLYNRYSKEKKEKFEDEWFQRSAMNGDTMKESGQTGKSATEDDAFGLPETDENGFWGQGSESPTKTAGDKQGNSTKADLFEDNGSAETKQSANGKSQGDNFSWEQAFLAERAEEKRLEAQRAEMAKKAMAEKQRIEQERQRKQAEERNIRRQRMVKLKTDIELLNQRIQLLESLKIKTIDKRVSASVRKMLQNQNKKYDKEIKDCREKVSGLKQEYMILQKEDAAQ